MSDTKNFQSEYDQGYTQYCVFSTFRDKIKRFGVVCRIEIFSPKMTVGHWLARRNFKVIALRLRNGER